MLKKIEVPVLRAVASSNNPSHSTNESDERSSQCSRSAAIKAATNLTDCYRRDDAANPEVFIGSIAKVFMCYPEFIAHLACDPVRGLPGKLKFVPSIAEVKEFCDAQVRPMHEDRRQAALLREQMARRALPPPQVDPAVVVEREITRFGHRFGIGAEQDIGPKVNPQDACMALLGLTREQFDAIENAPEAK